MDFPNIERLIAPRTLAILGASERPSSMGRTAVENVLHHSRFEGRLHLVNPRYQQLFGQPCLPSIAALPPRTVDVAMICVPASQVLQELEVCARQQVRFALIVTSGFAETGEQGAELQAGIKAISLASGMRIYGPNSPGLTNLNDRIGLTISSAFSTDLGSGSIALFTQGGGMGRAFLQSMGQGGSGVGLWASTGNEADLEISDFVAHAATDDRLSVVALIVEGFKDGRRFMEAARRLTKAGKRAVILKVGRSDYGVKAALSHTASLAGSASVNSAVFREVGIIEVDDLDELAEIAALLARAPKRLAPGICVYSFSGGATALAADMVGMAGLQLARLSETIVAELKATAPAYAALNNPIDLSTDVFSKEGLNSRCLEILAKDPTFGVLLVPFPADYGRITDQMAEDLCRLAPQLQDKIVVPIWMGGRTGAGFGAMATAGMMPFRALRNATKALKRLFDAQVFRPSANVARSGPVNEAPPPLGSSTEHACKTLLARFGIPVPRGIVVSDAKEASAAAEKLGGQLAMKISAVDILHKTDVGGVRLRVEGPVQAASAYEDILDSVERHLPGAQAREVLMEKMEMRPGMELIVGVHRDAVFGLVLTLGLGGIWVEVLNDVAHRSLPLSQESAAGMVDSLKSSPLLHGARGGAGGDIPALIELLMRISDFCALYPQIEEIDLNPVWLGAPGEGALVLDAVIQFGEAA